MHYYCDVCDETIKIKFEKKTSSKSCMKRIWKCIRIKGADQNPDFFDIDESFHDYISNHKKKIDLYLVKYDFELVLLQSFIHINKLNYDLTIKNSL